ncbi:MAG TPA: hypothetical protein PL001_03405, partial [Candidatus Kryptobacter bacterium]|nr:hypothetical protein [Candidatus Kryptobacter bacterium]
GAAPAFLAYKLYLFHYEGIGILISSLPLILGGIRLARFNVQLVGFDKDYFKGLPIPASAITVSSFILLFYDGNLGTLSTGAAPFLPALAVALSLLMVSTVRYDTLPKFSKRAIRSHPLKFMVFSLGLIVAVVTLGRALFWLLVLYVVGGLIRWVIEHIKAALSLRKHGEEDEDVELSSFDI